MFLRNDTYSRYDSGTLSYFQSLHKSQDHQVLSKIKIRQYHLPILDFEKYSDGTWVHTVKEVTEYIKKNPISDILSYNVKNRRHFMTEAI